MTFSLADEFLTVGLEELPKPIQERFDGMAGPQERLHVAVSSDMNMEGMFTDSWLLATDKRILVFSGNHDKPPLRLIKEAGFHNVRITLHPFRDAGIDENNQITDKWFSTLDWAVEQSLSNELMVILDFHEFHSMGRDPMGHKERFLATWEQMSEHYKDYPEEVIFEILNEPNKELTPELWNQFHSEALAIIRRTNPTRTVIIGPGHFNTIGKLEQLELPEDGRNIIVTVHYYSPMEFTHQGAGWSSNRDKIGVQWNATAEEKQAIIKDFGKAQAWSEEHDRPLFLGEFGSFDKADMDSRVRYTSFVTRHAEKLGWSWSYGQFDKDFVVYDIPNDKWVEPIRDALVPPEGPGI